MYPVDNNPKRACAAYFNTPEKKQKTTTEEEKFVNPSRKRSLTVSIEEEGKKARVIQESHPLVAYVLNRMKEIREPGSEIHCYEELVFEPKRDLQTVQFIVSAQKLSGSEFAQCYIKHLNQIKEMDKRTQLGATAIKIEKEVDYVFAENVLNDCKWAKTLYDVSPLPVQYAIAERFCTENLEFVETIISEINDPADQNKARVKVVRKLLDYEEIDDAMYIALKITSEKCKAIAYAMIAIEEAKYSTDDAIKTMESLRNSPYEDSACRYILNRANRISS